MKELSIHVVPFWAPKWKELGTHLELPLHNLKIIECDHREDCKSCCDIMLSSWLKGKANPCWNDLIVAVDALISGKFCYIKANECTPYIKVNYVVDIHCGAECFVFTWYCDFLFCMVSFETN